PPGPHREVGSSPWSRASQSSSGRAGPDRSAAGAPARERDREPRSYRAPIAGQCWLRTTVTTPASATAAPPATAITGGAAATAGSVAPAAEPAATAPPINASPTPTPLRTAPRVASSTPAPANATQPNAGSHGRS